MENILSKKQRTPKSQAKGILPTESSQIKSRKRVKDFAEVFTNPREVKAMVDLVWDKLEDKIKASFLEPAVGTGNFLVEILERKLALCQTENDIKNAYGSLYAYDIQADNVEECKERLLKMNPIPSINANIKRILNKNIKVDNFLTSNLLTSNPLTF